MQFPISIHCHSHQPHKHLVRLLASSPPRSTMSNAAPAAPAAPAATASDDDVPDTQRFGDGGSSEDECPELKPGMVGFVDRAPAATAQLPDRAPPPAAALEGEGKPGADAAAAAGVGVGAGVGAGDGDGDGAPRRPDATIASCLCRRPNVDRTLWRGKTIRSSSLHYPPGFTQARFDLLVSGDPDFDKKVKKCKKNYAALPNTDTDDDDEQSSQQPLQSQSQSPPPSPPFVERSQQQPMAADGGVGAAAHYGSGAVLPYIAQRVAAGDGDSAGEVFDEHGRARFEYPKVEVTSIEVHAEIGTDLQQNLDQYPGSDSDNRLIALTGLPFKARTVTGEDAIFSVKPKASTLSEECRAPFMSFILGLIATDEKMKMPDCPSDFFDLGTIEGREQLELLNTEVRVAMDMRAGAYVGTTFQWIAFCTLIMHETMLVCLVEQFEVANTRRGGPGLRDLRMALAVCGQMTLDAAEGRAWMTDEKFDTEYPDGIPTKDRHWFIDVAEKIWYHPDRIAQRDLAKLETRKKCVRYFSEGERATAASDAQEPHRSKQLSYALGSSVMSVNVLNGTPDVAGCNDDGDYIANRTGAWTPTGPCNPGVLANLCFIPGWAVSIHPEGQKPIMSPTAEEDGVYEMVTTTNDGGFSTRVENVIAFNQNWDRGAAAAAAAEPPSGSAEVVDLSDEPLLLPTPTEGLAAGGAARAAPSWSCARCTCPAPAGAERCSVCGAGQPGVLAQAVFDSIRAKISSPLGDGDEKPTLTASQRRINRAAAKDKAEAEAAGAAAAAADGTDAAAKRAAAQAAAEDKEVQAAIAFSMKTHAHDENVRTLRGQAAAAGGAPPLKCATSVFVRTGTS